ncbi:hypothetical protein KDA_75740 [Dictyobacter alpinus]|uniref:Uncharacterized protein n=1 Tax=Dictyobacter alpinus TaxID=2014873 RepID=A0A402BLA2_9CHLR|nr:sigma-70 family RNA polymerase sigma factor [Dictyobacter alpinus]GCE32090.1 hypothetical protein KDA_75740 [Dictyobacter alpinus]
MIEQQFPPTFYEHQSPEALSIATLSRLCAHESRKFLKKETSDDRYGLELFRRAIVNRDETAWSYLYQQYAPLVLTWVSQYYTARPHVEQDGYASLVNATFAKFAHVVTPMKLGNFHLLAEVLKYLKLCAHSVVTDEVRTLQSRYSETSLDDVEHEPRTDDPTDNVISALAAQGLWEIVQEELHGEEERVLILAYINGYKPAEIWDRHRQLFPTVDDVYRIKRNVCERMRRNRRVLAMCHH